MLRSASGRRKDPDMASDPPPSLDELTARLVAFRDARDWQQFHSLRSLILSVGVEAGELLELVQWMDDHAAHAAIDDPAFRAALAGECADIFIYLLLVAERAGFDLAAAAADKIARNAARYPVEKARGNARKHTKL
jgi:NTP pyrophosphatase (non-canonical NTP hydrolase)